MTNRHYGVYRDESRQEADRDATSGLTRSRRRLQRLVDDRIRTSSLVRVVYLRDEQIDVILKATHDRRPVSGGRAGADATAVHE